MSTLLLRRRRLIDRSSAMSMAVLLLALLASVAWWTMGPSYQSPGFQFGAPTFGPLPDGQMFALVRSVSPTSVVVDPAMVLTGEAAVAAAISDGIIPSDGALPNDVYIDNLEEESIAVPLAPDIRISVLSYDSTGRISPTEVTVGQFMTSLDGGYAGVAIYRLDAGAFPMIVQIRNGVVAGLVQPYMP